MTKYVLIWIVMNAGSVATGTAEFDDWIACQSAWRWLTTDAGKKIEDQSGRMFAICYPKERASQERKATESPR